MKIFLSSIGTFFAGLGIGFLVLLLGYAISWIATCGLFYLVTLIFGWGFNWLLATGIWLILCIIRLVLRRFK